MQLYGRQQQQQHLQAMAEKAGRAAAIARKALEQATAAAAAAGKPLRRKKEIELNRRIKTVTKTPWSVHFPNAIIQFMPNQQQESTELDTVKFRVSPTLNKFDIRQWIEAGYDTGVEKVNTINYDGRLRRTRGGRTWKRPDYKVAYVKLDTPWSPPDK